MVLVGASRHASSEVDSKMSKANAMLKSIRVEEGKSGKLKRGLSKEKEKKKIVCRELQDRV